MSTNGGVSIIGDRRLLPGLARHHDDQLAA